MSTPAFQCATAPGVMFPSREALHEHYKSEWHRYNLRRRAAGLAPIAKEVFDKVRQLAAQQEQASSERHKKQDHVASKNRKEEEEEEEQEGEEEEQEHEEREQAEPVPRNITQCFFCDLESETLELSLSHMHKHHGFMLHDLESVIDLPKLAQYVSDKVHVGMLCLTCEREFRSAEACKTHMRAKAHCRIPWEYEDELEEFVEFYDFTPAPPTGATMEMDASTGELILRQAGSGTVKRLGPGKEYRNLYREVEQANKSIYGEQTSGEEAYASAVKERSLQMYRSAGVLATSAVSFEAKTRLAKRRSEIQAKQERIFHEYALKTGRTTNWLIKHRKAGTNRGVGHGVHG